MALVHEAATTLAPYGPCTGIARPNVLCRLVHGSEQLDLQEVCAPECSAAGLSADLLLGALQMAYAAWVFRHINLSALRTVCKCVLTLNPFASRVCAGPTGSDPCGIGLCCSNDFSCVYDFDNSDLTCCERRTLARNIQPLDAQKAGGSKRRDAQSGQTACAERVMDATRAFVPLAASCAVHGCCRFVTAERSFSLCRSAGLVQRVRGQVLPVRVHMQRRHRAPQRDEDMLCAADANLLTIAFMMV